MGRLLDAAVTVDPTAGVHRLPQPFRMIDKILSGVVDDAADKAVARERRRLARLGIVEGTKMYRPAARTVELEHAATCVCVARFEDDDAESADWSAVGDASDARRTAPSSSDPLASSGDADPNALSHNLARRETERDATSTSRSVAAVVFAGDEDGCVLAVDAATGAMLGRVAAFPGRAIAAVTAATVAPPSPEDETFWRAGETTTRDDDDDASSEPTPKASDAANAETSDANDEHEGTPKEEGAEEKERDADDPENDPVVPLFDIAAAAGGPTPRDATPAMFVAAACEDAARVYAFDARAAPSKRFTPLCAASTPAGSTPASLRLAPDGRTLALAAGGGALAAYEVPAPKPEAFLGAASEAEAESDASERGAGRDVDAGGDASAGEGADDTDDTNDTDREAAVSGSEEGTPSLGVAQTHEDAAFAAATPLVWLAAARAADAFGAAPFPEAPRANPPGEGDADVSAGDEEGATDAEPGASAEDAALSQKSRSEAGDAATKTKTKTQSPPDFRAGAPDVYFRLDAAGRADALLAAWPGCNRAAMFSTRGALDALAVAAHRHDAVPSLRGERDPAAEAPADDEAGEPAPAPPGDDAEAAATLAAEAALAASAAYSTPACDWTTPFPVTASAAVSVGEVSLFALGLVDGTVLVLDARLGTVAARLDRLGAVAPPTETLSESLFATEATARASLPRLRDRAADADGSFGDGDGPPARTSLTSLTACVALAFSIANDARKNADTVELAAASAAGWTATFIFTVAPGSTFPKNPPASRFAKPRGDPHVAKTLTCQRGGPFCVVEGDAPDTRRARVSEEDGSERHFGDESSESSGSEPERDDDAEKKNEEAKTFVRAMDLTGARDLYGVFCPPERCAFALDASGRTIHCFDGSETAVVVARERRETRLPARDAPGADAETETETRAETEPAERPNGDGDGEDHPEPEGDPPAAAKPPSVTHTTHTTLCVYAVPRDTSGSDIRTFGPFAASSPPQTPAYAFADFADFNNRRLDASAAFSLDDRFASETTSPRKAPSVAPADEPGGPGRSRSLLSASARRLARILNARGGPAARRERFPKRLAELERKFERQSLAEGGRPPPAPLGAY